tara:strand:+ start:1366 stop:1773 length:408 start_codon:yes stop_codon:yes gene_type:complete
MPVSEKTIEIKKQRLLDSLEKSLGIVTTACKSAGVARSSFYEWKEKDLEFAKSVEEIDNVTLDFAESSLHKQINDGNATSTIFYLKTKGKRRGYIERTELDVSNSDGTLQPTIDTSKLTTDQLKALKDAKINADK